MNLPEKYKVNGYDVMELNSAWEVWNSDGPLAGPFERKQDAEQAAKDLPPKG